MRQIEGQSDATRAALASAAMQSTLLGELLDAAKIGVLAVNDGRYVAANAYACELTGYEREELIGRRVGELNPMSDLPRQFTEVVAGRRGGGTLMIRRKDGSEVAIAYRAVPTRLAGMELLLGVFWPIG
jgi:PAS domain S-box-containing protein